MTSAVEPTTRLHMFPVRRFTASAKPLFQPKVSSPMIHSAEYWTQVLGDNWPDTADNAAQQQTLLRYELETVESIRLDARAHGFANCGDNRSWMRKNLIRFMEASALIRQIDRSLPKLRILHVRVPPSPGVYKMLEHIISINSNLTDIMIEDDSHPDLERLVRPVLDLSVLAASTSSLSQLDCLIIRAPALHLRAILPEATEQMRRLRSLTTLSLHVHSIATTGPLATWICHLMKICTVVRRLEIGTADARGHLTPSAPPQEDTIATPSLQHVALDVDGMNYIDMLSAVYAPSLRYIQLRSNTDLASQGRLPLHHFPALTCAAVWCPGAALDRFLALGWRREQVLEAIPYKVKFEPDVNHPLSVLVPQDPVAHISLEYDAHEPVKKRFRPGPTNRLRRQLRSTT